MSERDPKSALRERPLLGLGIGVALAVALSALALFALVRVLAPWSASAPTEPLRAHEALVEAPDASTMAADDGAPSRAGLPPDFKLLGETTRPTQRDRCSEDARRQMAAVLGEVGEGDVVVDESHWRSRATDARVGLASWLSQCTQKGRAVRILGDRSGNLLATYDPRRGYVAHHEAS